MDAGSSPACDRFCNNAAVHSSRLLQRDPDGSVTVLAEGLRFANGVALSADESFVQPSSTCTEPRLDSTGPAKLWKRSAWVTLSRSRVRAICGG